MSDEGRITVDDDVRQKFDFEENDVLICFLSK